MNQLVLNKSRQNRDPSCAELMTMAEEELAAFFRAVKQMFGAEQAELSAEDWLDELAAISGLPASPREWRRITVKVAARLARRVNASCISSVSLALANAG